MRTLPAEGLVDLRDRDCLCTRRPLLIAHRGGAIAPGAPENSLAAVRLAAARGYDMVELDVREAKDGEPVLYHGTAGRGLFVDCGVESYVEELTSDELRTIRYRASSEHIATLDESLALCASLGLGVMLDIKGEGSKPFVERVADLLEAHGLGHAAMTISGNPTVQAYLPNTVLLPVSRDDMRAVSAGDVRRLDGQFWFGWAAGIADDAVGAVQRCGALVIPAINAFHYPSHAHRALACRDIRRLCATGADGFQIDSVYEECFV
jgi:hypothetical protein